MADANKLFECINEYNSRKPVRFKIQNIKQSLTHYPASQIYPMTNKEQSRL
jgi:hypothetical protein